SRAAGSLASGDLWRFRVQYSHICSTIGGWRERMTSAARKPVADLSPAAAERKILTWAEISAWRDRLYRRRPEVRGRTEGPHRQFIDEVGICLLFSAQGVELPSLWTAINGGHREIPGHHHDHALGLTWEWKDTLPARKAVWYGKLLRGKPMFVALDLLPAFYA